MRVAVLPDTVFVKSYKLNNMLSNLVAFVKYLENIFRGEETGSHVYLRFKTNTFCLDFDDKMYCGHGPFWFK